VGGVTGVSNIPHPIFEASFGGNWEQGDLAKMMREQGALAGGARRINKSIKGAGSTHFPTRKKIIVQIMFDHRGSI